MLTTAWGELLDEDDVLSGYPRPQLVRDRHLNLNGRWDFEVTGVDRPARPEFTGSIVVPFSPEAPLSGVGRVVQPDEYLWYRRTFELPEDFAADRVLLHFGAVDQEAEVWIDGSPVGGHVGGFLPFTIDITEALHRDVHEIVVRARDLTDTSHRSRGKQVLDPGGIWYTPSSGIWQTVWLESVPELHVTGIDYAPDVEAEAVDVTVRASRPGTAVVTIHGADGEALSAEIPTGTPARFAIPGPRLWSPEDPYLYDVDVTLGDDSVAGYFGMRSIAIGDDGNGHTRLLLNGRPYLHRGLLDQGYWPDGLMTAPSDEALAYDVQLAKELGFNMLRKHIKIEPLRWYHHCDRLGVLVWQDMVSGGERYSRAVTQGPVVLPVKMRDDRYRAFGRADAQGRQEFLAEVDATVALLRNVPSLVTWVPFNEGWGQFDANAVADRVKRLDPTRVVDHASGWHDQGGGDIASAHVYFRPYQPSDKELSGPRAAALTEYGGYSHSVPTHSWSDRQFGYRRFVHPRRLELAINRLQRTEVGPAIERGLSAFVYTQLSDVESETNGLITYDRRVLKVDPDGARATNEAMDEAFRRSLGAEPRAIRVSEREITSPVSLTRSDGKLNPDAVGFTRTPLIDSDYLVEGLRGTGRNKRWEHWGITTPDHVVGLTVAHLDYAGLLTLYALVRATGEEIVSEEIIPFGGHIELPGTLGHGRVVGRTKALKLRVDEAGSGSRIRALGGRVSLDVFAHRPDGNESLGVVVPWSDKQFQYTVKDVGRPATGTIWIDDVAHDLPKPFSFATLDHGRGRWPRTVHWQWGAGAGFDGRRRIGLQLGGTWTDGTGSVENAITIDGRLHKISQELLWDYDPSDWLRPWRVRGEGVDLLFEPFHLRKADTNLVVVSSRTRQSFGNWSGVVDVDGRPLRLEGLTGWVEDVHQKW